MYIAAFLAGLVLFFATHFYSAFRPRGDDDIKHRMGKGLYMGLYSVISLAAFVLMIWGYDGARPWMNIWSPPVWTRHIAMTLMLPAMILLVAAYAPTGFIKKAVKHPMLAAVKLWAAGHLIANGDLASIILFSAFLIYGVVDRIALKRRGDNGPVHKPASILGDMIAVAVGGAAFGAMLYGAHTLLIGVPIIG
jgi:uncharacterized membrane protein